MIIECPRCKEKNFAELHRSNDNIDNLSHSHLKCNHCNYEFNRWNESDERLRKIFGELYENNCIKTMFDV